MSSDDIVERLHFIARTDTDLIGYVAQKATDEIERLRAEVNRLRELIIEWDAALTAWRAGAGTRNMDVWHENCDRWDAAERALTEEARRG